MKLVFSVLAACWALSCATQTFAAEGAVDMARERIAKQSLIEALNAKIQEHQGMSADEIRADLRHVYESKQEELKAANPSAAQAFESSLAALDAFDKDQLVALEQAQLQQAMSSMNFVGMVTGMMFMYSVAKDGNVLFICGLPLWITLDIILLPIEVILTLLT